MSREDKARHTLHQTLVIDGFCRAGLAFGFPPPPLVFDFLCVPPTSSPPLRKQIGERDDFLNCTGFSFPRAFVFSSYFIVSLNGQLRAARRRGKRRLPASCLTVYVKTLKQKEYFKGVQKPLQK